MTYLINKWFGSSSNEVACVFRTTVLEDWLKAILHYKEKYHIKEDQCRWLQLSPINALRDKTAIFSFYTDYGENAWRGINYTRKPDFVYTGFPEGCKYVQI